MDDVLTVAAAVMTLGVTVGGGVWAVRFLWRTWKRFADPGATTREGS